MYVDPNNKGLSVYRAARAKKRVIAVMANDLLKKYPDKTIQECREFARNVIEEKENCLTVKHDTSAPRVFGNEEDDSSSYLVEVTTVNRIKR